MRPVMLGYQQAGIGTSRSEVGRRWRVLADYAEREGYVLAKVFVDTDADRQLCAFQALIAEARGDNRVTAVAVPTGNDLSHDVFARRELRTRLERETGLPVHVVEP